MRRASRLCSALAVLSASVAAGHLLVPNPLADVFFAAWVLLSVALALVGGVAAWRNQTPIVWVTALLLTGISVVGMWSIGLFIAPAALFLLGSALFMQVAEPHTDSQTSVSAEQSTKREMVLKSGIGLSAVAIGGGLVYTGAVVRDLFGACARETLDCAIAQVHWAAIGMTVLGLGAISVGGWLLWKQTRANRIATTNHSG